MVHSPNVVLKIPVCRNLGAALAGMAAFSGAAVAKSNMDATLLKSAKLELRQRRFSITPLQVGQEDRPFLRGSRLPHDLPSVQRLFLARRLSGRPIR